MTSMYSVNRSHEVHKLVDEIFLHSLCLLKVFLREWMSSVCVMATRVGADRVKSVVSTV